MRRRTAGPLVGPGGSYSGDGAGAKSRCRKGIQDALEHLKRAGYALWLITKGDLVRQAIKLSCFNFINLFDVVEIVDRKNVFTYRRVLAANGCPPCALTMVADSYWQDVVPVVRLGGRAVHLIGDHVTMLRTLEQVFQPAVFESAGASTKCPQ